jgi:MinD superfamily P-loop ATPase
MKQVLIISGKGGTGKTVITSAFAALAKNKVMVDCDVDAADLHILLQPVVKEAHDFYSGFCARLDPTKCVGCGKCIDACRFDAIKRVNSHARIDPIDCEGCGFCSIVCPAQAISMKENCAGQWFISSTRFGPLVHAKLGIAEENSGKLVAQVRQKATEIAEKNKSDWVIIDGSPGIGCPVIASLSNIDIALIVTEPTMSGLHDATRVIKVARHFSVPVAMIINKYDLNQKMTDTIETYCKENDIPVLGKIAFDESVVKAVTQTKTIIEYGESQVKDTVTEVWQNVTALLNQTNEKKQST